jgi:hypothetical protein
MKHVLFCPGSTVVEHSTLNPKIEGSNPTTWREYCVPSRNDMKPGLNMFPAF